jgi:hypothetical protein
MRTHQGDSMGHIFLNFLLVFFLTGLMSCGSEFEQQKPASKKEQKTSIAEKQKTENQTEKGGQVDKSGQSAQICADEGDAEADICMNFSAPLRKLCNEHDGGQQACSSNRWSRKFYERLLVIHNNESKEISSSTTEIKIKPEDESKGEKAVTKTETLGTLSIGYKGATFTSQWANALQKGVSELVPELLDENFLSGKARSDIVSLCPGYFEASESEKPDFWALFIASIAYPESGYKPTTVFREPAPLNENSIGLLQLSTSNGAHGAACKFKSESELKEAIPNLRCGLLILKNQIKKHQALFTPGYFYYWSVLRNKPEVIRDVFAKNSSQLSFCKKP